MFRFKQFALQVSTQDSLKYCEKSCSFRSSFWMQSRSTRYQWGRNSQIDPVQCKIYYI